MSSVNQTGGYDTIIVGSGPGGASVARVLAQSGQRIAILDQGSRSPLTGTLPQMLHMAAIPGRGAFIHSDRSLVMRAITAGGSSVINFATALAPPVDRFLTWGIDLAPAATQIRQLIPIAPLPEDLIGPMAQAIAASAVELGYPWHPFDKFIEAQQCRRACHRCAYGCPFQAKWSARNWLEEAINDGAHWFEKSLVKQVVVHNHRAQGVRFIHQGREQTLLADRVVLAAGGIGTPRILSASGLKEAENSYFVDPVIAIMGQAERVNGGTEVPMVGGIQLPDQGVTLSDLTLPKPLFQLFTAQVGRFHHLGSHAQMLTIMVKIADEMGGRIGPRWINKRLTHQDQERLEVGAEIATTILNNAHCRSIYRTHHFAAHPGGSAAIGKVVDSQLQTAFKGLYLCDASVLPGPWGIAPTYTLLALGLRLGYHLIA